MRCGTTTKKPISHSQQQVARGKKQQQCSFFVCFFVFFCFLESWFGLRPPAAAPTQRKRKGKEKRHSDEGSQWQNLDHATSTDDDDNKRGNLRKSQRVNKQIAIQKWEVKWTKTCEMCRERRRRRGAQIFTLVSFLSSSFRVVVLVAILCCAAACVRPIYETVLSQFHPRNSRNFLICFVEQKIVCFTFESFHSQFALDLLLLLSSQKTLAHSTYRSWLFLVKLLCTLPAAAAAAYILEQLFCILHLWTLSVWTKGRNQIHHYREFQDCQIHHQSFQSHHQRVFKIARFNICFGTRLIGRESLFKITIIDNSFITR